jgi:hypothetical protein
MLVKNLITPAGDSQDRRWNIVYQEHGQNILSPTFRAGNNPITAIVFDLDRPEVRGLTMSAGKNR